MNLNDFGPFSSDVWGTVSDWGVFLVTIIGTYFVVRTFQQQSVINLQQLELNRLAMEKDKRDILPSFKFRPNETQDNPDKIVGQLYVLNNSARNAQVFPIIDNKYTEPLYGPIYRCIPDNPNSEIYLTINKNNEYIFDRQYSLYFEDEVGRPYLQHIGSQNGKHSILIPLPTHGNFIETAVGKSAIIE